MKNIPSAVLAFLLIMLSVFSGKSEEYYNVPMNYYYGRIIGDARIGVDFLEYSVPEYIYYAGDTHNKILYQYFFPTLTFGKTDNFFISIEKPLVYVKDNVYFDTEYFSFLLRNPLGYQLEYHTRSINGYLPSVPGFRFSYVPDAQVKIPQKQLDSFYYFGQLLNKNQFEVTNWPSLKYGIKDNTELDIYFYAYNQYLDLSLRIIEQLTPLFRASGEIAYDNFYDERYYSLRLDTYFINKNMLSFEQFLGDENNFYLHLACKNQLIWEQALFLSNYEYSTEQDAPAVNKTSLSEYLAYGILDLVEINSLFEFDYSVHKNAYNNGYNFHANYSSLALFFKPGIKLINYKPNSSPATAKFNYLFGQMTSKGQFQADLKVDMMAINDNYTGQNLLDPSWHRHEDPSINIKYGLLDKLQVSAFISSYNYIINQQYVELEAKWQIGKSARLTLAAPFTSNYLNFTLINREDITLRFEKIF